MVSRSIFVFLPYNEDAMTTEDTTTSEAKLDVWRKCPYLTVDEAMNLIMGFVPGAYRFNYAEEHNMPDGSVPIYRALIDDICNFRLLLDFDGTKATDANTLSFLNVVSSYEAFLYSPWWLGWLEHEVQAWVKNRVSVSRQGVIQ